MDWKYARIVYSDNPYGEGGKAELLEQAKEYGVCFGPPILLSERDDEPKLRRLAHDLLKDADRARGILLATFLCRILLS